MWKAGSISLSGVQGSSGIRHPAEASLAVNTNLGGGQKYLSYHFVKFRNFWWTDQQTDQHTQVLKLLVRALTHFCLISGSWDKSKTIWGIIISKIQNIWWSSVLKTYTQYCYPYIQLSHVVQNWGWIWNMPMDKICPSLKIFFKARKIMEKLWRYQISIFQIFGIR